MAPPIKNKDQLLPDWAKSTARQVEDLSFAWEFDWEYPVPEHLEREQVRDEPHNAPAGEVTRYAEAMRRGDRFPPAVVTRDGKIVDGNTRINAARKNKFPTFPVLVIDVDTRNATEDELARVAILGAAANSKGPKPLTREEKTRAIRKVAGLDWKPERVAQHLGTTRATVHSIFAQFRAEERAVRLGVPFNGSVSASHRAMLGAKSDKLTDRPFRELARLAQDSGLTTTELSDLCKQVEAVQESDDEKIAIIESERAERGEQIKRYKASGKSRPPLSSELRKRLKFIIDHQADPAALADYNPGTAAEYLRQLETAAGVLRAVTEIQHEAIQKETVS